MADQLIKGRIDAWRIGFGYAVITDVANEAVRRHNCDPVGAHVLGRAMTAALLSAAQLGDGERLNARWTYRGLLRTVLVDAGVDGVTRGFLSPAQLADAEDGAAIHGEGGSLTVVRFRGAQVLATGTVEAAFQDVVDDLDYFHAISDQVETGTASVIALGHDPERPVRVCRGLLLHALPDADLTQFSAVRDRMRTPAFRELLTRLDETDSHVENLLHVLTGNDTGARIHLEAASDPVFRCTCTREKMGDVLRALGYEDRMDIVQKKEPVAVNCRMCNERYVLTIDECIAAWNSRRAAE